MKRRLIALAADRKAALTAAQAAYDAKDQKEYEAQMEKVQNINAEIAQVQNLIAEQERQILTAQPSTAEARDMAEERANLLRNSHEVQIPIAELMRAARNADGDGTLYSSSLTNPSGAGSEVNDNHGQTSLLELVRQQDMTGLSSWEEPYAITDPAAKVGVPASVAGTARAASDPTFGVSVIKPYEVTTTSFVDRNIARLSPTQYMAKVQSMARRALWNKIAALILLGDAENTHVMYGMLNGTNKAGSSIVDTVAATVSSSKGKVDEQLLNSLYFAYGDSYEVGGNAMLFCNKTDLKAWGALRGTNEKGRLFSVSPAAGQANRGVIADGGVQIPYLIDPNLVAVDGTAQAASTGSDKLCCIYGDPQNYLLGFFGDYTIRVDESVKAIERMYTILGDAMVGGNVIVDKGFVIAKIAKAAT